MTDIPRRTIVKSLKKKGFIEKPKGDHDWFVFCHNGFEYKQIMAKISRGSSYKTYSKSLWTRMKERLGLDTNVEVANLLECPMDHDTYLGLLRENKLVPKKMVAKKKAAKRRPN